MHLHVSEDYIRNVIDSSLNESGEVILYDFLEKLMKGIQRALGDVNNFEIIIDNETNTIKIIDNMYIPGSKHLSEDVNKSPIKINVNTLKDNFGSFVKEVSISSEISKDLAAEISIAASSNSNSSNKMGHNGSRFSHLNEGCENRILILSDNFTEEENTEENLESKNPEELFLQNREKYNEFIKKMFNKTNRGIGDFSQSEISEYTSFIKDYWNYEKGIEESSTKGGRGFIPINLSLTMDGLSGMRIYEKFTINNDYLPSSYIGVIDFIIKGISHNIDNNGWETKLETLSIPSIEADVINNIDTNISNKISTQTTTLTSIESNGLYDIDVTRTIQSSTRKNIIDKYGWPIKIEQRGNKYYGIKIGINNGRIVYALDPIYKNQWVTQFIYNYKDGTVFSKKLHQGLHEPLRKVLQQIENAGFKGGIKNIDASIYARDTTDDPGILSGHSFGVAMDFNSNVYGYGVSAFNQYQKDLKDPSSPNYQAAKAIEIIAKSGLFNWGGNYTNTKDTHHFTFEPFFT